MVYENSSNFYWFNFWAKVILNNGPLSSFLSSPVCIWTIVENISRHSKKQKIKSNYFEKMNKIKRSWFTQLRNLRSLPLLVFIIGSTSDRDFVKGACCVTHAHTHAHTHPHAHVHFISRTLFLSHTHFTLSAIQTHTQKCKFLISFSSVIISWISLDKIRELKQKVMMLGSTWNTYAWGQFYRIDFFYKWDT